MCKYEFYAYSPTTEKQMLYCKLKNNETNDMLKVCSCQRYCIDKDIYLANEQQKYCINYTN